MREREKKQKTRMHRLARPTRRRCVKKNNKKTWEKNAGLRKKNNADAPFGAPHAVSAAGASKKKPTKQKNTRCAKKKQQKKRGFTKKTRVGHLARPKCLRCVKKQNKQKNASAQKTNKQINVGAPLGAPHAPLARHAAKPRKPGSSLSKHIVHESCTRAQTPKMNLISHTSNCLTE